MNKVILVTESGADIPPETAEQHHIHIIPMHVSFGADTHEDGSFPPEEICGYYERTGELPKTSGSTPAGANAVFDEIHNSWPEAQILCLSFSSSTSCCWQSALIAAEDRAYVTVLDTKAVSAAQGAIVLRMARLLEAHPEWDITAASAAAEDLIARSRMCFIPDDLEYLRAGGRVSNAVALCGKLLGIHPLIEIQDGSLVATRKLRGRMRSLAPRLVADYAAEKNFERDELWLIWVTGFPEEIKGAVEESARNCGFQKVTWVKAGGVITTHGGPSAFGVVGFSR